MGKLTFREGEDYRWRKAPKPKGRWALPIVRHFFHDYERQAELLRDYVFRIPGKGRHVIRKGYRWNGVSAGMAFRATDDERVMRASLPHDWLYDKRYRPEGVTQPEADRLFFQILKEDRAPRWFVLLARASAPLLFPKAWRKGIT